MKPRYEIIGEWSGYSNPAGAITRLQHREYTRDRKRVQACETYRRIHFTDGTYLFLTIREMKKGERAAKEIPGYKKLIDQCVREGKWSVAELSS